MARLCSVGLTLARYDALFFLETLPRSGGLAGGLAGWLVRLARLARLATHPLRPAGLNTMRPGQRLAAALTALGPGCIKLGQALSTRSDIIGEAIAADLVALQDRLPPFPGHIARETIAETLDRPAADIFSSFDDIPVAAASIAQVHRASLTDENGAVRYVAVKVLRPGVEAAFARDLDALRWLARQAARNPGLRRFRPVESVEIVADSVRLEMDLRLEAAAATELRAAFLDDPSYRVPAVEWLYTGQRVLTTEWVEGIPVHDRPALLAAGHDLEEIVRRAARVFFVQVFSLGFFHADMHPGNLFVAADGTLVAVDFGIMGRLDPRTRDHLADMLPGFLRADYRKVAEVHFRAGYVPPDKSLDAFAQALRSVAEPILDQPIAQVSIARLLAQLFQITRQFDMPVQPELLLLQKTMLLAEGVGRQLAPDTNMWLLAEPLVREWMREHRGPEARLAMAVQEGLRSLAALPGSLRALERLATEAGRAAGGPAPRPRGQAGLWLLVLLLAAALVWSHASAAERTLPAGDMSPRESTGAHRDRRGEPEGEPEGDRDRPAATSQGRASAREASGHGRRLAGDVPNRPILRHDGRIGAKIT